MGLFDKIREVIQPSDEIYDNEFGDDEIYGDGGDMDDPMNPQGGQGGLYGPQNTGGYSSMPQQNQGYGAPQSQQQSQQSSPQQHQSPPQYSSIISGNNSAVQMKIIKPENYDSVKKIADHLIEKCTIVLNLEETNKEAARRLTDFLSGVSYAVGGQLKKVASNTYIITPRDVDVSAEQVRSEQNINAASQRDNSIY